MAFFVGQKVVCVETGHLIDGKVGVSKGEVYTIAAIDQHFVTVKDADHLGGWYKRRFRPVVERKTDISSLVEIARRVSQRGRIDA